LIYLFTLQLLLGVLSLNLDGNDYQ